MLTGNLIFNVNSNMYLKDPNTSTIGKEIVEQGLAMMEELGFEKFTFRKLAQKIDTTEATIYRYFENKHLFLLFLTNWYWSWMEYRLTIKITNIEDPVVRLQKFIQLITESADHTRNEHFLDERLLKKLVMREFSKTYLTLDVDEENKAGFFQSYKQFVEIVSCIVLEIAPTYNYPHALISTCIEAVWTQSYFSKHLPKLSNQLDSEKQLAIFCTQICLGTIQFNIQNETNGK
jgi:AcrR family transcriptional regulator